MKRTRSYILMGIPVPWARPGRSRYSHCAYDTQKEKKQEYGWHLKAHHGAEPLFSGPLHIDLTFFMPITRTAEKRRKEKIGNYHCTKPDADNLAKFVIDSANGILWQDDSIIARLTILKIWSKNPRTEMTIIELENDPSSSESIDGTEEK